MGIASAGDYSERWSAYDDTRSIKLCGVKHIEKPSSELQGRPIAHRYCFEEETVDIGNSVCTQGVASRTTQTPMCGNYKSGGIEPFLKGPLALRQVGSPIRVACHPSIHNTRAAPIDWRIGGECWTRRECSDAVQLPPSTTFP